MSVAASMAGQIRLVLFVIAALTIAACASSTSPIRQAAQPPTQSEYLIGPGDTLKIFVWQNPDLSQTVPVRPDGRISLPLIQDMPAAQKTPTQLAADITKGLETYVKAPLVTVIVTDFVGPYSQQVRVVGEATKPQAIPYRENMSVLDVMIVVGGLTPFAAGDRAVIARGPANHEQQIPVRLSALLDDGDLSANVTMMPGDILVIPKSWF
jgi:polysaccharide export outer membrane protein